MSIATFPQPLYARSTDGNQLIVLGVKYDDDSGTLYLVMLNDVADEYHGRSFLYPADAVIFEHFYWPEIEPVEPGDFQHPQEPALKVW